MMYLCYIDESGTSDIPGNTSHFILAGVSLPIWRWRDAEIHTAWLLRKYLEQSRIRNFENLNWSRRSAEVRKARISHLLQLQRTGKSRAFRQARKNYLHTDAYVHLTLQERNALVGEVAECVSKWGFARLFAECIDKVHFDPVRAKSSVDEQTFEQIVSRFERYLRNTDETRGQRNYGLLVHDNNETVERKHTLLMRSFYAKGTLWTNIGRIIETPFFVDSQLTSMVQIADLCSYALRRYLENGETLLFDKIYSRADRKYGRAVGARHFTDPTCQCEICKVH